MSLLRLSQPTRIQQHVAEKNLLALLHSSIKVFLKGPQGSLLALALGTLLPLIT